MLWKWDSFLAEGDKLFEYMTHNFENMFDEDSVIKHFDIRYGTYNVIGYEKEIRRKYCDDIQKKLIPWIHAEIKSGRFFEKSLWKPIRDPYDNSDMFFGYRYFFQYETYFFQLAIYNDCLNYNNCNYCDINDDDDKITIHFELALYGWKNGESDILYPNKGVFIPSNTMVPLVYWNRE